MVGGVGRIAPGRGKVPDHGPTSTLSIARLSKHDTGVERLAKVLLTPPRPMGNGCQRRTRVQEALRAARSLSERLATTPEGGGAATRYKASLSFLGPVI